jgi:hypothetical protein
MTTIRNANEQFGEPICYEGETVEDAIAVMQADIRACGDEFRDVVVTVADYEIVSET